MQNRGPKRREVLCLDGAKLNVKLLDKAIRLTIIQPTGHYAFADLDISGSDRLSSRLDMLSELLDKEAEKRGEEIAPLNTDEEGASYDA